MNNITTSPVAAKMISAGLDALDDQRIEAVSNYRLGLILYDDLKATLNRITVDELTVLKYTPAVFPF